MDAPNAESALEITGNTGGERGAPRAPLAVLVLPLQENRKVEVLPQPHENKTLGLPRSQRHVGSTPHIPREMG